MRDIERKPIPVRSRGLTGDLRRLKESNDSFLIEDKGLKRAVLYSTASRLGIRLITMSERDGLRVWRNFDADVNAEIDEPIYTSIDVDAHGELKPRKTLAELKAMIAPIESDVPRTLAPEIIEEDWQFTSDRPTKQDSGDWLRYQFLVGNPKKRRTVVVDEDDFECVRRIL